MTLDQDFQMHGNLARISPTFDWADTGAVIFGQVGAYRDGAPPATPLVIFLATTILIQPIYEATAVFYGTTGGSPILSEAVSPYNGGGNVGAYSSAANCFVFDGGGAAIFSMGNQGNAYGWNPATGAYVGPTALTVAHLDAALGAGTGFGKTALWPLTGSRIAVT